MLATVRNLCPVALNTQPVSAITFSDDGPCAQLNAASMFRIRRRWPKSNRCPDDSGKPVRRGGGGGDDGVMRWMDGASERAQARVAVVRDVKIVRQKIFVIILLSLSSRDYFSVGFSVTRAGRGTGSAAATPGAVCVTTRGRRQTVTNGNF